jgi:hypothetical protein
MIMKCVRVRSVEDKAEAQNVSLSRVDDWKVIHHSSAKQDVTHKELVLEGKGVKMNGY